MGKNIKIINKSLSFQNENYSLLFDSFNSY